MYEYSYAQIDDAGLVVAELQTHSAIVAPHMIPSPGPGLLGYTWDGSAFIAPDPMPAPRHITSLAFRRRFARSERTAIEWAAVDRTDQTEAQRLQAAEMRADLKSQDQATYIDLDDADTIDGVQALEAIGLIATGRADEILSAEVRAEERP